MSERESVCVRVRVAGTPPAAESVSFSSALPTGPSHRVAERIRQVEALVVEDGGAGRGVVALPGRLLYGTGIGMEGGTRKGRFSRSA
jgi:hypothetical protein